MKERSKESKERKAAVVAVEEKTYKEKAAATSCAGTPPRTKEGPPASSPLSSLPEELI